MKYIDFKFEQDKYGDSQLDFVSHQVHILLCAISCDLADLQNGYQAIFVQEKIYEV